MNKRLWATALLTAMGVGTADAAMVTERWGVKGPVQHPGTLRYESKGKGASLMVFDLSALPKGAAIYRARVMLFGVNWKQKGFDIVPAERVPAAKDIQLKATGRRLTTVAPCHKWLDATDPVRACAKRGGKSLLLWMRSGRSVDRDRTILEIAFEGKAPGQLPKQVSGVRAVFRSGQVFITFKEIDPPDGGKDAVTIGELSKKMAADYYRPVPTGPQRYRVYQHDEAITAATIGQAELLGEVLPGSAYNARFAYRPEGRRKGMVAASISPKPKAADAQGVRVAIEDGKPLDPGTGVYVHTVLKAGKAWYAVLASANGVTNAAAISNANTAGPVSQRPGDPTPVMYKESIFPVQGAKYARRWYSLWTVQPLSPVPARYDVIVEYCPEVLAKGAPLTIHRHGWNSWPRPARPEKTTGMRMTHTADQPVDFRLGLNDAMGTIKGFDQGTWKPFHSNRQRALVRWMLRTWPIDPNRIHAALGAWGMMEIKHGSLYAFIHGWGQPELTKGFQCWNRARGIWGEPEMYQGRPDAENPYVACNFTDWVLADPARELPFVFIHAGGGAHYTEMGWPPQPRFAWALMQAKQPFVFSTARSPVAQAVGRLAGRRDRSVPALAHCTLDDNIGEGDIRSGKGWSNSQVNGYVMWDPETVTDEAARWEMTLWVDASSFHPDCTVDLTPRRCRKFTARAGQRFAWRNTLLPVQRDAGPKTQPAEPKEIQSDTGEGDKHGLVTLKKVKITKGQHRIRIVPVR